MSLTDVSYYVRKYMPFAIIGILGVFIFFYMIRLLLLIGSTPQQAQVYLDPIFQKIKAPVYREASPSAYPQQFSLDTIEGKPVTATDSAQVFYLPAATTNLGFRDKIYLMAKAFGFSSDTKHVLNGTDATFADGKQTLSIDVTNFNFTYRYEASLEASMFSSLGQVPTETQAAQRASDFLTAIDRYPQELSQGKTQIIYFAYAPQNNSLRVVDTPQMANVVEVDFYRPDVNDSGNGTIVSPLYFNSQNFVVLTVNNDQTHVIKAQVRFFEKSNDQVGVYPIRTGDDAWNQLKGGKAHIVFMAQNQNAVTIKKMYMAYMDPDIYQSYLQPVYVFMGTEGFVAYVPAVSDAYLLP